jgi:hypothetical protein
MQPVETIAGKIRVIRGVRVLLDADLAALYGVSVRRLNEQVRRNAGRFPSEFCFRLSAQEVAILKSQNATSSWGGRRKLPLAFTEHGALMAATVLTSPEAIKVSVSVIRAFVQMRETLHASQKIGKRLDELERKVGGHDRSIAHIFDALRQLTAAPEPAKKRRIGFL